MLIVESGYIVGRVTSHLYFIIMCIGLIEWAGPHHEIGWSVDSLHFTDSLCVFLGNVYSLLGSAVPLAGL